MKPLFLASVGAVALAFGSAGCENRHAATPPVANDSAADAHASETPLSFEEIADGQADDPVAALAALGRADLPDDAFRLFQLTEVEYVRELKKLQQDEVAYRRYGDDLLALMRSRKVFISNTIEQIRERAARGEVSEVDAAIAALRRVASVSSREGQIEIGRLIAVNIEELLDELERDLSSLE